MANLIRAKQIAAGTNGQVLTTSGGVTTWANNVDLYITGTTFNTGNYQLQVERNDGSTFSEDLSILSSDFNVTGGTYNINTGIVTFTNNSGGTFNVTGFTSGMTDTYVTGGTVAYVNEAGTATYTKSDATTFQVVGFTDTNITGGTYSNSTGDITLTKNDGNTVTVDLSSMDLNDTYTTATTLTNAILSFDTTDAISAYTVDLSPLLDDTNFYTTGSTLIGTTAYFDRTDTLSAFTLDLSSLETNDTFVTGGTMAYVNEAGTATFTDNDANTFQVTGINDTNITGGTYSNSTGDITLTKNDGATVTVDLSSLDLNDTYTTATTLTNAILSFDTTDAISAYTVDLSPLLDDTNFYTTGSTVIGTTAYFDRTDTLSAFTLDLSGVQQAVPTTSNKEEAVTGTTTGNDSNTFITIAATPSSDGYVGVSVNGVWYTVGDNVTTKDCYFFNSGVGTVVAIADIQAGDTLYWNGVIAGFELETTDNVALHYDV